MRSDVSTPSFDDTSSLLDSSVSTPPIHLVDTSPRYSGESESLQYTSLTIRQFISMLLQARQSGHDDLTEHHWRFIPHEATQGRHHLEYLGRRIMGIQFQCFVPTKRSEVNKNYFCIYGCRKGGLPEGDREWLGCWKYTIPIYFCLLTADLVWHIIGQTLRRTR